MKYLKIISDILPLPSYSVIIICFFFPFMTISCGGNEIASMTGFEIAKGTDFKKKMSESEFVKNYKEKLGGLDSASLDEGTSDTDESQKSKPVRLLFIPFFLAILGLVISFVKFKRRAVVHIILSILGFLCLLFFGVVFQNSDELNSVNSLGSRLSSTGLGEDMLAIKLKNAYYFSCVLFAIVFSFYAFELYYRKNFGTTNDDNEPDVPQSNGTAKSQSERVEEAIKILENL
jgi:hypothetical protein